MTVVARRRRRPAATAQANPDDPSGGVVALACECIDQKKGIDIVSIDLRGRQAYADFLVIAHGTNDRQIAAIVEHLVATVRERLGRRPFATEGAASGRWVLVDYGDIVIHIFHEQARWFYDLEGMWADAEVRRYSG